MCSLYFVKYMISIVDEFEFPLYILLYIDQNVWFQRVIVCDPKRFGTVIANLVVDIPEKQGW